MRPVSGGDRGDRGAQSLGYRPCALPAHRPGWSLAFPLAAWASQRAPELSPTRKGSKQSSRLWVSAGPYDTGSLRPPLEGGPASLAWGSLLTRQLTWVPPPAAQAGQTLRPSPTHHVQDALVVGDDDTGVVLHQFLAAPDVKAEAVQVLEGPDKPAYDAADETVPVSRGPAAPGTLGRGVVTQQKDPHSLSPGLATGP